MLRFTKMDGAGNDFILIDNRAGKIHLDRTQIARLCDRHRGIGADGILLLEKPSDHADFRMRYFNADGGEAEKFPLKLQLASFRRNWLETSSLCK